MVAMPETAVDKNHSLVARENNVRTAGQQAKAQAACVQGFADQQLRLAVLTPDRTHVFGAYCRIVNVWQDTDPRATFIRQSILNTN